MDKENSKFIWIRSYGSTEKDIEEKEKLFYESKWWKENVNYVRGHLGKIERLLLFIQPK